ncbi:MAG: Crp/Fnr family transcriptional regulator [Crocinitomicaceae bacterium]|nr:Crp/Fnr family transcriptional regulator [Crocinitomicaceae bacterium]
MHIDYDLLITYGGIAKKISKGEIVFSENSIPRYYYQVIEGSIKIYSSNKQGKELIQDIYTKGQSFGEPPLLLNKNYLISAEAQEDSVIVVLKKENFLQILNEHNDTQQNLIKDLAERVYNNTVAAQILANPLPEEKIIKFLNQLIDKNIITKNTPIPYTRQQIANHIGLRVETVIRSLNKLQQEGKVKIINRKLHYL